MPSPPSQRRQRSLCLCLFIYLSYGKGLGLLLVCFCFSALSASSERSRRKTPRVIQLLGNKKKKGSVAKAQNSVSAGCTTLQKLNFPCHAVVFESIQLSPRAYRKCWNCFPKSLKARSPYKRRAAAPWQRKLKTLDNNLFVYLGSSERPRFIWKHPRLVCVRPAPGHAPW